MSRIKEQFIARLVFVGRAARFCIGMFAVLAIAVVVALLIPVMLLATLQPTTVLGRTGIQRIPRAVGNASEGTRGVATASHGDRMQEAG